MTMVTVRVARVEDVPGLVESLARLFAEDGGQRDPLLDITWPRRHGAENFTAGITDPSRLLLVAAHGTDIVGHLTGSVAEPSPIRPVRVATLASMYVFPEHRGTGVGSELVKGFREWAREQGAAVLAVTAFASNERAVRFYQREGFSPKSLQLESSL